MEIVFTAAAGILVLLFVCIIALCVRWKLKSRQDNNQAIYNQSTVSSSGGYATAKPHTRSSWACTYKAGRQHQVDTHIWETPLPEPSAKRADATIKRSPDNPPIPAAMLDSMEYTMPVPSTQPQLADLTQAEYTQPVKQSTDADMALPSNPRQSVGNYYYYDPSGAEQTDYMQPASAQANNPSDIHHRNTRPMDGSVQEKRECDYRTLVRMDEVA